VQRLQILVTEEQSKWLKKKSYEEDISIAEIIRSLIDKEMKGDE
jgi:hypothetical protein